LDKKESQIRLCSCHFTPNEMTKDGKRALWGTLPKGLNSIQAQLSPITPNAKSRGHISTLLSLGLSKDLLKPAPSPAALPVSMYMGQGAPTTAKASMTEIDRVSDASLFDASPTVRAGDLSGAQKQFRSLLVSTFDAQTTQVESKEQEIERLQKALVVKEQVVQGLLRDYQGLMADRERDRRFNLNELSRDAKMLPPTFLYMSIQRVELDPRLSMVMRTQTSLPDVKAFYHVWKVFMAFTGGALPVQVRPNAVVTGTSHYGVAEHQNFLFFVLFVLRTGPHSVMMVAALFDFDPDAALRWYATWLQAVCMILARWMPQPDLTLILRTSPPKFKKLYNGRLVGILDCTERRFQTPSDKRAQRATYSEYKSNNTVKYLLVMSPAGACIYVSPAFPGRISDPQICQACAAYGTEDPENLVLLVVEQDVDIDE
jgi:hypothetical protein